MGLARPAELNGYPGPAHVLEMAEQIGLTAEQKVRTQSLFDSMQSNAAAAGRGLVEEERALDRFFATRAVAPGKLSAGLEKIAAVQGKVGGGQLEVHRGQAAMRTRARREAC